MASQLLIPRATQIGLLLALLICAYVAGKCSGLPGKAEWWTAKVSFVAANAIFILLVMERLGN
jgi:predicted small integral membrane protein